MPIGTQLLSKDGPIGTVTANNNVTVSYPVAYRGYDINLTYNFRIQFAI